MTVNQTAIGCGRKGVNGYRYQKPLVILFLAICTGLKLKLPTSRLLTDVSDSSFDTKDPH